MNSLKVRNVYILPELQNAWDIINKIAICYTERKTVADKAIEILDLMDELRDELKNPLEEGLK